MDINNLKLVNKMRRGYKSHVIHPQPSLGAHANVGFSREEDFASQCIKVFNLFNNLVCTL